MKSFWGAAILIFVGVAGWRIGGQLSTDALGMAVGILFGVMAGIPTALILLASQRRDADSRGGSADDRKQGQLAANAHAYQPPVIVVAGHAPTQPQFAQQWQQPYGQYGQYGGPAQYAQPMLPGPAPEMPAPRHFKVVGEEEEMVEQW
ncbi:MAG: hypothetical protein R3A44_31200 [Caldilineaceae bacterium]